MEKTPQTNQKWIAITNLNQLVTTVVVNLSAECWAMMLLGRNLSGHVYMSFLGCISTFQTWLCLSSLMEFPVRQRNPCNADGEQKLNAWITDTSESLPWMHWPNWVGKYPSSYSHIWIELHMEMHKWKWAPKHQIPFWRLHWSCLENWSSVLN